MAFDIITPVQLGRSAINTSPTLTTLYTVPSLTRTIIKTIDIVNTTAIVKRVNVYLVPSAGSAGTANALLFNIKVPANGVVQWSGTQIINAEETIEASASASGITITVSGGEAV